MALAALPSLERRVHVFLEELWVLLGTVRVVTACAVHYGGTDADMGLAELLVSKIMTGGADVLQRFCRNKRRLIGRMGFMAPQAVSGGRGMDIGAVYLRLYPFMATQANIRALRDHEFGQLRFMRIMALRAKAVGRRLMAARAVVDPGPYVRMALEAYRLRVGVQHAIDIAGVGIMAFEA